MAKFSGTRVRPQVKAPIATTGERTVTHEGGVAWVRDAKSDLFLLAATNMVSERTFYEKAKDRDERFEALVHQVTVEDPKWVQRFIPFLRTTMLMRSASLVAACEYVAAGGPEGASVIASACERPDEPAETLGYWIQRHGRNIPAAVKRGVARAAQRLYTQRSALKYDGESRAIRMGDVLELAHPKPKTQEQSRLFAYLLDVRHHPEQLRVSLEELPLLAKAHELAVRPVEERRAALADPKALDDAGLTWERLAGWLQGPMDAAAWEAVIPSMGYMALLRNLRNFDEAGVSDEVAAGVIAKLRNPDEVARSRQFPIRFLSAWKAARAMRWGPALEEAIDHSLANVPSLPGQTLIMIDVSGSMQDTISQRSEVQRWEVAGVFGTALSKRAENADLVLFASGSEALQVHASDSTLRFVDGQIRPRVGGGTQTWAAFRRHVAGHDRVVIVTDEQAFYDYQGTPDEYRGLIYTFNVAGYAPAHLPSGEDGRYTFGGLTDAAFRLLPLLEEARHGSWPF